jgi:hypothetical protein
MDQDWTFWLVGGVSGVVGVMVLYRALLADRSRGRPRCPRCFYDMSGIPGLICPECGKDARSPQALRRTRRQWRVALLGVVLTLTGGALGATPKVRRENWLSIVPTTGLILFAPEAGTEQDRGLYAPQPVMDPVAAELLRRQAHRHMTPWQWRLYLRTGKAIQTRPVWPVDQPFLVRLRIPRWLGMTQITLTPRGGGASIDAGGTIGLICGTGLSMGSLGGVPVARPARAGHWEGCCRCGCADGESSVSLA